MCGQHDLDRQPEQRPQVFDHLLARDTVLQYLSRNLEPATEVDQCVAGDDRTHTLVFNYMYDLPKLGTRLRSKPAGWVLDNWQVSGITSFISIAA